MLSAEKISPFAADTQKGLIARNKYLLPRYFYDAVGSTIFQKIMQMPEYYLTNCEMEIFQHQSGEIVRMLASATHLELIELGSGDGLKSMILAKQLTDQNVKFTYIPVDISTTSLQQLSTDLKAQIPGLKIQEMAGDFFTILKNFNGHHQKRVVLFLGSNIGNFLPDECDVFMKLLAKITMPGDKVLIGFDLKKSPEIISAAYNDPHGHTRAFNINHLERINRELNADFVAENFMHHVSYNPASGAMKSFLISRSPQKVYIGKLDLTVYFRRYEAIFMELSRKFDLGEIDSLAQKYGFRVEKNFIDRKQYFADSLWVKI